MSLKGHLGTIPLPELLQWLAIGNKSGTLVVEQADKTYRVVVDNGRIVGTASSDPQDWLGNRLVRSGQISDEALERALKLRDATGVLLGGVLLTLELLDEEKLQKALVEKAEALISDLFTAEEAQFHFEDGVGLEGNGLAISLDVSHLVLTTAQDIDEGQAGVRGAMVAADVAAALDELEMGGDDEAPATMVTPPDPDPEAEPFPEVAVSAAVPGIKPEQTERHEKQGPPLGKIAAGVLLAIGAAAVAVTYSRYEPAGAQVPIMVPERGGVDGAVEASLAFPEEVPPTAEEVDAAAAAERQLETRLARLISNRSDELRNELDSQYREELDELRQQLEDARTVREEQDAAISRAAQSSAAGTRTASVDAESPAVLQAAGVVNLGAETEEQQDLQPTPAAAVQQPQRAAVATPTPARSETVALQPPTTVARLLRRVEPAYPRMAAKLNREAEVVVQVLVGEDGTVKDARIPGKKIGFGFDQEAIRAARRSAWEPATDNGRPVEMWVDLRFSFRRG